MARASVRADSSATIGFVTLSCPADGTVAAQSLPLTTNKAAALRARIVPRCAQALPGGATCWSAGR
jgi:hypothetical protein